MPTLEEQLKDIELEEEQYQVKFPNTAKLESWLSRAEDFSWTLAIIIDIIIISVFYFYNDTSFTWVDIFGILGFSFYPGFFIVMFAQIIVHGILEEFIYYKYKLSKEQVTKIKNEYRWQIIVKADKESDKNGTRARHSVARVVNELHSQSIKSKVKIIVDVDPAGIL